MQLTLVSAHLQQPPELPIVAATADEDLAAAIDAVYEQLVARRAAAGRRLEPQEQFEVWQATQPPEADPVRLGTLTILAEPVYFEYQAADAEGG